MHDSIIVIPKAKEKQIMTTKREWVLKAFKNEKVDKVPVGFWYHFTTDDERGDGFNPEIFNKNIAGHKKFVSDVNPDFVKVMLLSSWDLRVQEKQLSCGLLIILKKLMLGS